MQPYIHIFEPNETISEVANYINADVPNRRVDPRGKIGFQRLLLACTMLAKEQFTQIAGLYLRIISLE